MEQKFFDAVSPEQQEKSSEFLKALERDAERDAERDTGKTREDIKGSYARRLAERLKVKA